MVAENFSRAVATYTTAARSQREMAKLLIEEFLPPESISNPDCKILDVGCGTGFVLEELITIPYSGYYHGIDIAPGMVDYAKGHFADNPRSSFAVEDVNEFSADSQYDLILSNCCLQWIESKKLVFERLLGALKSGGLLVVSLPVAGSLPELHASYEKATGKPMNGLNYEEPDVYTEMCQQLNAVLECHEVHSFVTRYPKAIKALRAIHSLGATFNGSEDYRPLDAGTVNDLIQHYDKDFSQERGEVTLTYKTLYLRIRKP